MLRYFAFGYRDFSTHPDMYSRRLNWEFMAILEGECAPLPEGHSGPLVTEPTLWCMPRRKPYRWFSNGPCLRAVFHFAYVPEVVSEQALKDGCIRRALSPADCETIRQCAERLVPLYYNPTETFHLHSTRALMDLSIIALAGIPFAVQAGPNSPEQRRVVQAESWFREHLRRRPKMDEVAASVGVSVSQLRRSFQRVHGMPPHEMFKKMRLHEAMRLLSDTDMTLEQVAMSSGFASLVDFHRCFKVETTVTPDTWRKHLLENNTPPPSSLAEGGSGGRAGQQPAGAAAARQPIPYGRSKVKMLPFDGGLEG